MTSVPATASIAATIKSATIPCVIARAFREVDATHASVGLSLKFARLWFPTTKHNEKNTQGCNAEQRRNREDKINHIKYFLNGGCHV